MIIRVITGLILSCVFILIALVSVCLYRAYFLLQKPNTTVTLDPKPDINITEALQRFSDGLKIPTVVTEQRYESTEEFHNFIGFLEKTFTALHKSPLVTRDIVANSSLLYTIQGSDSSLKPYMFCSHIDVVPADEETWNVDPFGGVVIGNHIYGRGTVDTKGTLMGSIEAVNYMIQKGFEPKRTILLAYGHDEEVGGFDGAANIAKLLKERHPAIEYIIDEGSMITKQILPGIDGPLALVSVAEKTMFTVKLEVKTEPPDNAIARLARATSKFHSKTHSHRFGEGIEKVMFEQMAPYAKPLFRIIFSNFWLFGPLFAYQLSKDGAGDAMMRTTTAVTMINGGSSKNVEKPPNSAWAYINHRVHPSQTLDNVLEVDRKTIQDPRVTVKNISNVVLKPVSKYGDDVFGYSTITRAIYQIVPTAVVVPSLLVGATDSKWYLDLSPCVYRFSPMFLTGSELAGYHGNNERISIRNYERIVHFYYHLMVYSDK